MGACELSDRTLGHCSHGQKESVKAREIIVL